MSRLKDLLRVATPGTCNTQQKPVQVCSTVAQHMHSTQQAEIDIEARCKEHRETELRHLVRLISDHEGFTVESYEEAMTLALADPVTALTCFTSLARQANLSNDNCTSKENRE